MTKSNIVWEKIISREYGVQYTELSLKSLSPACKFIVPKAFYEQVYMPDNINEACYISKKAWNSFVMVLKRRYLGKIDNYEKFEKLFMQTGNAYAGFAKQIASSDLARKSNKNLKKLYLSYQKKSLKYAPFIWIQFIINNFFADKAKEIITRKLGKKSRKIDDFYRVALTPDKKAASVQLAEISSQWRRMTKKEKNQTYKKFQWIPCLDIHNKPWSKEKFFSHVKEFQKTTKEPSISFSSILEVLKPFKKEKKVLSVAKRLAYLKDLKDDFRRQGVFYGQSLFKEIARRMKIKLEDLSYILEGEVVGFLDKKHLVPQQIIKERRKGFAIFFTKNKRIVCKSGNDVGPALADLGLVIPEEFKKEIKGIPASSGRAKGVVAIVRGVSELGKMKKGYVLVTVTTHPDYVPAMQKAVAIVTEEGGLTSHAAIVSRELGIPCIVGTKIATKVLNDGDRIEVDALKGIVKIL